jgi:hypothetical protein
VANLRVSDTIITFNWDIMLDNILKREEILKDRYEINENKDVLKGQYYQFIHQLSAFGEMTWDRSIISPPYTGYSYKLG